MSAREEIDKALTWAEGLILQLPASHEGRNSWLLNHGVSEGARRIQQRHASPVRLVKNEEGES